MVDIREPSATLHGERSNLADANGVPACRRHSARTNHSVEPVVVGGESADEVPVLVNSGFISQPRILVEDDAPWLVYLCKNRYSHRYDQIGTEQWFRNVVLKQPGIFLAIRTQNAFLIALISFIP